MCAATAIPRYYASTHNTLYRNNGDGTFTDVSEETGIAQQFGKGMSVTFADYDGDGYLDAFVANDTTQNFLFHNLKGKKFEEVALLAGVGYAPDGIARSGMGADFRDVNNDGLPDIWHTAVEHEGFPLWINEGKGEFQDMTVASGLRQNERHVRLGQRHRGFRQRWMERPVRGARQRHGQYQRAKSRRDAIPSRTPFSEISGNGKFDGCQRDGRAGFSGGGGAPWSGVWGFGQRWPRGYGRVRTGRTGEAVA